MKTKTQRRCPRELQEEIAEVRIEVRFSGSLTPGRTQGKARSWDL